MNLSSTVPTWWSWWPWTHWGPRSLRWQHWNMPQSLFSILLSDGEQTVRRPRHPLVGAEVCHKELFKLFEWIDTYRLKSGIPYSSSFLESDQKNNIEKGIGCPLKKHESFIALKMVEWVGGAIIWLHLWHLESTKNWFIEDPSRKR